MSSSSRENWAAEATSEASKALGIGNLPVSLHAELAPTVLLGWPSWKTLGSRFGAAGGSGMSVDQYRTRNFAGDPRGVRSCSAREVRDLLALKFSRIEGVVG